MSAIQTYAPLPEPEIVYPDSDGKPMADNTLQWEWIAAIKQGLEAVFKDNPQVFVAGDLLWYPVKGKPKIRNAPDAMVAFGRPKGYRGSYMQWREDNIAPQVVFEVLSPGNRPRELIRKFRFYEKYGVEEYYIYDPEPGKNDVAGYLRKDGTFEEIADPGHWTSPRLGVTFELTEETLKLYGPDGKPFATYLELIADRDLQQQEKEKALKEKAAALKRIEELEAQIRNIGKRAPEMKEVMP